MAVGDYRAAEGLCTEELAREGGQLGLYVLRAYCNRVLRRTPQMNRDLDAAHECCKTDVLVLRARCGVIATKSRYAKQIADLSELIGLDPKHAGAYLLHRAYCCHWTGNDDAARDDLRIIERRRYREAYTTQDFWFLLQKLGSGQAKPVRRRAMARATRIYRGRGHRRARVGWAWSRRRSAMRVRVTGALLLPEGRRGMRRP